MHNVTVLYSNIVRECGTFQIISKQPLCIFKSHKFECSVCVSFSYILFYIFFQAQYKFSVKYVQKSPTLFLKCTLKYLIYKAKISQQSFCVQTFEHKIFRRIRTFVMNNLAVTVQSLPLSAFFFFSFPFKFQNN